MQGFDTTVNRYYTFQIGVPGLSSIEVRHIPAFNEDLWTKLANLKT